MVMAGIMMPGFVIGVGRWILFVLLVIAVEGAQTARAGNVPEGYRQQHWTREQGLPDNSVRALAQTREGYLWLGTDGGLSHWTHGRSLITAKGKAW